MNIGYRRAGTQRNTATQAVGAAKQAGGTATQAVKSATQAGGTATQA